MNPVPDIYRILPEVDSHHHRSAGHAHRCVAGTCTVTPRPLGWVAAIGTTVALWASLWQLSLPAGTGFSETVETSPFTVFFHVLICGIVLVTLLLSLDTLPGDSHHQGEYYALITFGAVGMCLMTGAVELLVVFIALEISSISTYILAGYRKQTGRGPESAIKYFLLGSFATAFPALRNCDGLRSDRNDLRLRNRTQCLNCPKSGTCACGPGTDAGRNSVQGIRCSVPCLDARRLRRRAFAGCGAHVDGTQGGSIRISAAHRVRNVPDASRGLVTRFSGSSLFSR